MSETQSCAKCSASFEITEDDKGFYQKIDVPIPEKCPRCRQQQRILFRNFKTLYKRNSDKDNTPMVSMYSNKAPFPVWSHEQWWSDDWDPMEYARDVDFSRPFFEQFKELRDTVPHFGIMNTRCENCQYSNLALGSKNCYLVFGCVDDEDCNYGHIVWNSKETHDSLYAFKCELCYECVDVLNSYRCLYCQECEDCADSFGLFDCRGCTNCIGCVGLQQKSYYLWNEQVSKEEYSKFLEEHPLHDPKTIELISGKQHELRTKVPQRHFFGSQNTNVSGNHMYNCNNVHYSFDVKSGEDSKFVYTLRSATNCYDCSFCPDLEGCYQVLAGSGSMTQIGCQGSIASAETLYCKDCQSCNNLFGCVGLKSSEYCILNKQYSKSEYKQLVEQLKDHMKRTGEWGGFFPEEIAPFAYNESIANEYMPLSKEEALAQGFRWEDDIPRTSGQETISHEDLPKKPSLYSSELKNEVLKCEACANNYKLIDSEINFYKQIGLALPQECFNCRNQRRMNMRNPRVLWNGACAKCGGEFQTSYTKDMQKEYPLYCEECYKQEMV